MNLDSFDGCAAVTASDSTADPNGPFAALAATGAGTVKVTTVRNQTAVLSIALGIILEVAVSRVWATGGTATGITGLYRPPYKGPGST